MKPFFTSLSPVLFLVLMMEIILSGKESTVYKKIKHWGIFENYFKKGNYLAITDKQSYAKVKIYDLEVSH